MKKTKKLPSVKLTLLIILALLIVSGLIIFNFVAKNSNRQIRTTGNKSLSNLTHNLGGKLLAVTEGEKCDSHSHGGKCYKMQTAIFLVDYPPDNVYQQLVQNLNQDNWTRDGQQIKAVSQEQIDKYSNTIKAGQTQSAGSSLSATSLALLTPGFFGETDLLKKDDVAAYVFVWGDDKQKSENDSLYILRAEIPATNDFDFNNKVWAPFKKSSQKTILAIAVSK